MMSIFCNYRNYFMLGCLTSVVVFIPNAAPSAVPAPEQQNVQLAQSKPGNGTSDEAQIKKALLAHAQKEGWCPKIGSITITNGYAIASTYDDVTGGESLLKKEQGVWKIIGGTGGAFSQPEELVEIGKVPLATARRLIQIRQAKQQ